MDLIANMLTQLRNGSLAGNDTVNVAKSSMVVGILDILKREGFIKDFSIEEKNIVVTLRYDDGKPFLNSLKKISKQGSRIYVSWKDLQPVVGGRGVGILSTSQGILSAEEAIAKKVGGEYICKVW